MAMGKRLPYLVIFLVAGSLYLTALLTPLERALTDLRFRLIQREATGDLVIVQIDARSLQELGVWPWPREFHARLGERLFAAGVREVALDIDLSASSNQNDDRAFARMLERHDGKVILPVFRQLAAPGTGSREVLDTTPLTALRAHAQLGAVNMLVDSDGLIRRAAVSHEIESARYPSMFTLLAGPAYLDFGSFFLDYGIDPWTIPRLSYVDVLRGRVAPDRLAGKRVIVGAAAIELGDNLTVPVHRSLPGPVVQALAYESLVQGRAIHGTGAPLALLIGAILAFVLGPYLGASSWRRGVLVTGATVLGIETAAVAVLAAVPINLNTAPWLAVVVMGLAHGVLRLVSLQDLQLFRQRMALTHRRALMDRVVENSFDGIVTTDHRGNIAVFNRKAAEILGCHAREVVGRSLRETFPVAADFVDRMAIEPAATGVGAAASHSGPHECEIERPNGERIAIELVISRFLARRSRNPRERRTRQRQIHTVTFRDIAERKQARDAERAASEQAQAANRAKSEFLANMSHELRTPLNAILGFSEMVQSEILGPITPPQYAAYIGDIHDSGQHLLEIINDILDVSKIELGQIELNEEVVDLKATADACCRILSGWPASAERDFEARVMPEMPGLFADARLIKQTLVNLLSNAVKYSDPGDRVALHVFVDSNGVPTIEVEDSGIGIEPSMIPALTEPFYQVDGSLERTREGNGLGLCLVSAFMELHGGSLEIESELTVGTKVSVRFPPTRVVALADMTDPAGRQASSA